LLGYIMERLGLRLRDPAYTLDHVQMAGGLLIMALAMRNVQVQTAIGEPGGQGAGTSHGDTGTMAVAAHVNEVLNAPVPGPGLDGQPASWSLVGLAYAGQIEMFIEPDPAFVPPPG
jgi:hypothetical protein